MTAAEDAARAAYDEVADTYAEHFRGTGPESEPELAVLRHAVGLLPAGARVLDAGCGAGRLLPVLASLGVAPEGVDLSPAMAARARADHPGFVVRVAPLGALPYDAAAFDGVVAWYSTIHLPDDEVPAALAEITRVTRPGGLVVVAFQSGSGSRDVAQGFRARGHDVTLIRHHRSLEAMCALLAQAGLVIDTRLERAPVGHEGEPQAVVVARRRGLPVDRGHSP